MSNRYEWIVGKLNDSIILNVDEIKELNYIREAFNDPAQVRIWQEQGHQPRGGLLYDMRYADQPRLTQELIDDWVRTYDHVGVSYYRMQPGDNLPYHSDTYKNYVKKFNIGENRLQHIWRFIIFAEDWKPGHILEIDGVSIVNWHQGDWVAWKYDTPHMAANLGHEDRYTIQLTGLLRI